MIMAIARKLVRIVASTVTALPVNQALLPTHPACFSFLSSQLGTHFGFQKRFSHWFDCCTGCLFCLLLDALQNFLALLPLSCSWCKRSPPVAEDSLWLGRLLL
jgi:hypothetical protein